jgi:hypothetical protein
MIDFLKYLLIDISQKLSGPVWVLGHFHFSMNWKDHEAVHMLIGSALMTSLVILGIWLDYKQQKENKDK